ncbi:MAG: D-tyrosyl-tRNA(Tyr) deacylase [Victivallales bacterium]|jgi:D-aminoacyl-tRNA deacylase|nr:D-tyrosyl-tRNA(Tyr) deacylase [Victivallales bacterium]
MRALIQRVAEASVRIDGEVVGTIGPGILVLLGVREGDTEKEADFLAEKCLNLRIFEDEAGKMNRSVLDMEGEVLVVSQFTLYGDCRKGRRPSYTDAAPPLVSEPLYEHFVKQVRERGVHTATGRFGAMMAVSLTNDGPVTLLAEKEAN